MGNIAMEIGSSRNTAREATVLREANSGAWWTGHWCTVRTGEVVALVLRCHVPSSYTQTYQPALPVSDRPGKVETPCPPNLARHLGVGFMPPCAQLVQCMNPRNPVATISAVGSPPPRPLWVPTEAAGRKGPSSAFVTSTVLRCPPVSAHCNRRPSLRGVRKLFLSKAFQPRQSALRNNRHS